MATLIITPVELIRSSKVQSYVGILDWSSVAHSMSQTGLQTPIIAFYLETDFNKKKTRAFYLISNNLKQPNT